MLQFDDDTSKLLEQAYQGGDITRRRRMAFDALHLSAGDSVVDIGCGNGLLTQDIARAIGPSGAVLGVDPSAEMRALAAARCAAYPSAQIVESVATRLPLPDANADKAVAAQVLEYLPDIPAAIREAHRVLRVGGRFVAVDTGGGTLDWFSEDPARMQRVQAAWAHHYTEDRVAARWSNLAQDAGFTAIEVVPFTFCDVTLRPDGLAFMLMHLMSGYAAENGHMSKLDTQAWFDEQVALAAQGRFFFSLTYYRMSGVKT